MSRFFSTMQKLWQSAEWNAPPWAEQKIFPLLYEIEDWVMPFIRSELHAVQLRGQTASGPLSVTWVGLDYGQWVLKQTLFEQEPEVIALAPFSIWRPQEIVNHTESDIVVAGGSERWIRRLPRENAIIVPLYLEHVLDLRGDLAVLEKRLSHSTKSVREDMRLFRKYSYTYETSHSLDDLKHFYHALYLPTMAQRHGGDAVIVSPTETHDHFAHGGLLLVKRDGQTVGGILYREKAHRATLIALGVLNGDENLYREGAIGALYLSAIRWAKHAGFTWLDFMGNPPFLQMGVFQYKRKWGTNGGIPRNLHKQLWLKFQHDTPTVRRFLQEMPCATIDARGGLHGLVVVEDARQITPALQEQLENKFLTPAMKDLQIKSADELLRMPGRQPTIAPANIGTSILQREQNDSSVSA